MVLFIDDIYISSWCWIKLQSFGEKIHTVADREEEFIYKQLECQSFAAANA